MPMIVIHPFGAYQPGDIIPDADTDAILASEAAGNVVLSQTPAAVAQPEPEQEKATAPQLATATEPEPEQAHPLESEPEAATESYADTDFITVSENDPS